jgi:hypothetical protein
MFHADRAADTPEGDRLSILETTGRAAPALNEAKSIARALKKIPEDAYRVVQVDGHSADAAVAVAPKEIAEGDQGAAERRRPYAPSVSCGGCCL